MDVVMAGLPPQSHREIKGKPLSKHGLILSRDISGRPAVNVPRVVVDHDAGGFDFGSHRSKDRELALNAMHAAMKAAGYNGTIAQLGSHGGAFFMAFRQHVVFGQRFIYSAPSRGCVVPWDEILVWLQQLGLVAEEKGTA